ncbi:terminase gpA endonuclease subunit [Phaeobacter sp. HF9A]|uniref:terminase gpA endonuclease subunit n=1 Tax=Phaeobacter sp. HF9A TaxID=2721561 RepID=UPI0034C6362C
MSLHANAAWGKLAAEFVAAKNDPSTLQTFVNTILGTGWRSDGDELAEEAQVALPPCAAGCGRQAPAA